VLQLVISLHQQQLQAASKSQCHREQQMMFVLQLLQQQQLQVLQRHQLLSQFTDSIS
jgi:hypothetical protein